jgi:hypothetical protein
MGRDRSRRTERTFQRLAMVGLSGSVFQGRDSAVLKNPDLGMKQLMWSVKRFWFCSSLVPTRTSKVLSRDGLI